jgi:signal transduction histidine kinase
VRARQRLGRKLFLSHLIVVLVGALGFAVVAQIRAPRAFDRAMSHMGTMMTSPLGMAGDIRQSFVDAVTEVLLVAVPVSVLAALIISTFMAWRIIAPIRVLMEASRRIAAGDYSERLEVVWSDELGELARSFNRMAEALDDTEKRRMELIGDVAHELRTPLASIRSLMEALTDGVLPSDAETFLDVQRETARLQRLTDELAELSRVEGGAMELRRVPAQPAALCRGAAAQLDSQFAAMNITLRLDLEEPSPEVSMDPERILQALINLLGNALQYTDSGGTVALTCHRNRSELHFSVSDTGIGIPAEDLPRIFDRFYRVDKSRSRVRGGSGIGLTIAKHIVRAHGGTMHATSVGPGHGSTFSFRLPIPESPA